ncbi:MAG: 1-acyl-sn-glycerol-3-phosphate acyltransferase [Endomicrobia bacterium]|nr:1-acyl-sn-glycerol-3-phosphate acyltransferase [Endomicrobiia bacterium]MCL2506580.1 1-acyl-sn-glycerol-3-phosphate acyltransferase [Endomicrobiia bacterium]MCL2506583.1 1-acyl-sn-glycerol-3-phosphate acyltransferase [Endomicrobiia bacterium]
MKKEKASLLYTVIVRCFRIMFALFYRWEIYGTENIPADSGAIIAPNHISWFDPPLSGSAMKRPLHFMAKKELFDIPVFSSIIRRTNAFPVKRGVQDMAAMRNAFAVLERGSLLLMFPEGTRSKTGQIGKARAGAGMVACNAHVPLIPTKIENTNTMLKFKKIKIKFGKPIYPPENCTKNDYTELSQKALDAIAAM